ncbi:DUF2971 domain-containing protein [Flavobacterium azooxidireducens]|uniref:DUF2971 domain-containing protein n=1 Tax=Flavobacterium azooxidireducens TaxID=1871076 RepID=A0ABY4KEB9_9FLAO|nr:DUF2971 domain-containing protein [Flavobacterium azooxidireducens]UPQ79145.1 DUF2971 domain-containing protein [Flavobacterium azooxidireducens]
MKIYKYCPPKRNHLTNLVKSELWFRSPNNFDDNLDSNLPHKQIPTIQIVNQFETDLNNYSIEVIKHLTPPKGLILPMQNPDDRSFENLFKNFKQNCIGITCFTGKPSNKKMWNEFAENETGFCLGFETENDNAFFRELEEVKYYKELPKPDYSNPILEKELEINFLSKLSKYKFEEELRLIKLQSGGIRFNKESLQEIILGRNISNYTEKRIMNILKGNYKHEIIVRKNI